MNRLKALMNDWTPWDGARDFKGNRPLRVRFRNGMESKQVLEAHKWRGKHGGKFPRNHPFDIVAVRVEE